MLKPLPSTRWDFTTAAHLLNRAGFGGTPAEIEKLVAELQKQLDVFEKRIRRFLKVYPQIIFPEAGAIDVPRDVDLPVQVNSSSRINNTHEVVIVLEGAEDVVLIGPVAVQFLVAGRNPGTARFPAASMSMPSGWPLT